MKKPRATPRPTARTRLNLEFPPALIRQMKTIQLRTNAASLTEVIRRAVALYDLVTENDLVMGGGKRSGGIVLARPDGTKETVRVV